MSAVFDNRICALGEGPLWHPLRKQLFWFDITGKRLLTQSAAEPQEWAFDEMISAAGWVDRDTLLIASETGLFSFDLATGARTPVATMEAENTMTRSNDGRADRQGGFWIGTMGKAAEPAAGAIYRYYRGELRQLYAGISIPNAMCFAPDGGFAYFTDTPTQIINRVPLDAEGWPSAAPAPFVDLRASDENPDGAVVDAAGNLWVALWGSAKISVFDNAGKRMRDIPLPAPHITCPAYGGETLFATSATQGMDRAALAAFPDAGRVFSLAGAGQSLPEPQVIL